MSMALRWCGSSGVSNEGAAAIVWPLCMSQPLLCMPQQPPPLPPSPPPPTTTGCAARLTSRKTVTSMFTMSPSLRARESGMPWQMHSLTEVHTDLGKRP